MDIKINVYHYSFGDVTYYETSDASMFETLERAQNHQKFIDEVAQYTMKGNSKLSKITSVYRIDNQPQLDMFIIEMEELHDNFEPVHYEVVLDETEELKFPLFLSLAYHYDSNDYSYYMVDNFDTLYVEWREAIRFERQAYVEATEALCALQE